MESPAEANPSDSSALEAFNRHRLLLSDKGKETRRGESEGERVGNRRREWRGREQQDDDGAAKREDIRERIAFVIDKLLAAG